ncbi:MAG: FecR domain-containing protein [Rhodothermales bacterium]
MSTDHTSRIPEEVWAEAADDTPRARQAIERIWEITEGLEAPPVNIPDDETAWADVQARLAVPALNGKHRARDRAPERDEERLFSRLRWTAPLVGVVLLAIAGVLLWRQPVTIHVPIGEMHTVQLPDGSLVEMNSGSTIRFQRGFAAWPFVSSAERRVELEGEAFFEVQKSTDRPFFVLTANAETRVMGTSFNIWARAEGRVYETRVTLATGVVEVRSRTEDDRTVRLDAAGAMARIGAAVASGAAQEQATLDYVLSWRRRGFVFVSEPLSVILDELERRFGAEVTVEVDSLRDKEMTVLIARDATPESILSDVCLAMECRFRKTSQGYSIYEAGAPPTR